jgi:hypothetical protein
VLQLIEEVGLAGTGYDDKALAELVKMRDAPDWSTYGEDAADGVDDADMPGLRPEVPRMTLRCCRIPRRHVRSSHTPAMVAPSRTPEARRARWALHGERLRAERRAAYAADPERRARYAAAGRARRAADLEGHREADRRRTAASYVMQRKAEVGRCQRCGYDRCLAALDWHHVDPSTKAEKDLRRKPRDVVDAELAKCVLICSNCHKEAHAGLWVPELTG